MEKSKKTKILAVGDIHGDTAFIKKLAAKAKKENVDLVILAGDLTFAEMSVKNIIGPFIKEKKRVLIIPGNHESIATTDFLAEMYPDTQNIHGYSFKQGDLGIFGAGAGDIGIFRIRESELFDLLQKGHDSVKDSKKKIMVTHLQPSNTIIERVGGFPGSKSVRKAIEKFQPDIAICAHLHNTGGIEEKIGKTKVISVSRKEKIFEI